VDSMIAHEPVASQDAAAGEPFVAESASTFSKNRAARRVLHVGGFTMDTITGAVNWRGRRLALAVEERELLGVLLRRAGQILSVEHLAKLMNAHVEAVDRRIAALVHALEAEGIQARPRRAVGLGYIFWH
jgi:DNA-binding response OmpR family regulator